MEGQLELVFSATVAKPACKAVAVKIEAAENVPLSPEQNNATVNTAPDEAVEEYSAKMEASRLETKNNGCKAENGVASHVLILHDRLGGFIRPPPSLPPDRND
jgi:hypothetical protein